MRASLSLGVVCLWLLQGLGCQPSPVEQARALPARPSPKEATAKPSAPLKATPPKQAEAQRANKGPMMWRWIEGLPPGSTSVSVIEHDGVRYEAKVKDQEHYELSATQAGEVLWSNSVELPDDPEHALLVDILLITQVQLELAPKPGSAELDSSAPFDVIAYERSVRGYRVVRSDAKTGQREEVSYADPRLPTLTWRYAALPKSAERGPVKLTQGQRRYEANYSRIASGAKLRAVDLEDDEQLWEVSLRGLGPIDHSQYLNEVRLELMHDHVVVYGHEASGDYIEAVDPGTGVSRAVIRMFGK